MRATRRRHGIHDRSYDPTDEAVRDTMSQVESSRAAPRRPAVNYRKSLLIAEGMHYRCKLIGTLNGDVDFYATYALRASRYGMHCIGAIYDGLIQSVRSLEDWTLMAENLA